MNDMDLPAGKTCGDCTHIDWCERLFGCPRTNKRCDWSPSRFDDLAARKAREARDGG